MAMLNRRQFVATLSGAAMTEAAALSAADQATQWFPITADDGKPVPNMRAPVELAAEVDDLGGVIWTGSQSSGPTLVEFFDYNCPYCRKAAGDLHALLREIPELRLVLVNNPILSPSSEGAARIELAVLRLGGPLRAYEFHRRLFERRGIIDSQKALAVAEDLGAPRNKIEAHAVSSETDAALSAQMRLAASLGMAATPSFLIGGASVFGYPGPNALKRAIGAVRHCGQIAC